MIDINNSQDYDSGSIQEYLDEQKSKNPEQFSASGLLGSYLAEATARHEAKKELTDPIEYLHQHYPGESLFRFVLTHPDLDHMRGLKKLHEAIGFINFWDTSHTNGRSKLGSS
jgi:competence protein ComEC